MRKRPTEEEDSDNHRQYVLNEDEQQEVIDKLTSQNESANQLYRWIFMLFAGFLAVVRLAAGICAVAIADPFYLLFTSLGDGSLSNTTISLLEFIAAANFCFNMAFIRKRKTSATEISPSPPAYLSLVPMGVSASSFVLLLIYSVWWSKSHDEPVLIPILNSLWFAGINLVFTLTYHYVDYQIRSSEQQVAGLSEYKYDAKTA